jgi:hypothetical protein
MRPSWYPFRIREYRGTPKYERLRETMPYGMWTCEDGRQVLFNRDYHPIWQRYPGAPAIPADPEEWVLQIKQQNYFFDDSNPPWIRKGQGREYGPTARLCRKILAEWTCKP